jgi:hypothetical protein
MTTVYRVSRGFPYLETEFPCLEIEFPYMEKNFERIASMVIISFFLGVSMLGNRVSMYVYRVSIYGKSWYFSVFPGFPWQFGRIPVPGLGYGKGFITDKIDLIFFSE